MLGAADGRKPRGPRAQGLVEDQNVALDIPGGRPKARRGGPENRGSDRDQHLQGPGPARLLGCRLQVVEQGIGRRRPEPAGQPLDGDEVHRTSRQLRPQPRGACDVPPEGVGGFPVGCTGQQRRSPAESAIVEHAVHRGVHPRAGASGLQRDVEHAFRVFGARVHCEGLVRDVSHHPFEHGGVLGGIGIGQVPVGDRAGRRSRGARTPPGPDRPPRTAPRGGRTCGAAGAGGWRWSGRWWPPPLPPRPPPRPPPAPSTRSARTAGARHDRRRRRADCGGYPGAGWPGGGTRAPAPWFPRLRRGRRTPRPSVRGNPARPDRRPPARPDPRSPAPRSADRPPRASSDLRRKARDWRGRSTAHRPSPPAASSSIAFPDSSRSRRPSSGA